MACCTSQKVLYICFTFNRTGEFISTLLWYSMIWNRRSDRVYGMPASTRKKIPILFISSPCRYIQNTSAKNSRILVVQYFLPLAAASTPLFLLIRLPYLGIKLCSQHVMQEMPELVQKRVFSRIHVAGVHKPIDGLFLVICYAYNTKEFRIIGGNRFRSEIKRPSLRCELFNKALGDICQHPARYAGLQYGVAAKVFDAQAFQFLRQKLLIRICFYISYTVLLPDR